MKTVILAGGLGTRLSEETVLRPKPMVEVGGKPLLWHVMKIYSHYGFNDFVICLGYKGYMIKEWFANYFLHTSDVTIELRQNKVQVHSSKVEDWKITLIDTGDATETGGRIRRVRQYLDGAFMLTYGDGLADIDIPSLLDFHRSEGRLATVTAVQPPGRFGAIGIKGTGAESFQEKPRGDGSWINGGFFVLEQGIFDYIDADGVVWEREPLQRLAAEGRLSAFRHTGFWQPMDTLRHKNELNRMWEDGSAPWKIW